MQEWLISNVTFNFEIILRRENLHVNDKRNKMIEKLFETNYKVMLSK